ncbi:MAG: RCC1 domain-containing protein [Bdellovibrionales bacterium]
MNFILALILLFSSDGFAQSAPIKDVFVGGRNGCVSLIDGSIKCWGDNDTGQLGLGDNTIRGDQPNEMGANLPTPQLGTGLKIKEYAGGTIHNCALFENGRVKCWGYNYTGALGLGHTQTLGRNAGEMGDRLPFVELGTDIKVKHLAVGFYNTCAVFEDGKIKCWGRNNAGQLGLGDRRDRGDEPGEMGANLPFIDLGSGEKVENVWVGRDAICALLQNKKIKCWGYNTNGQLGLGDQQNRGDTPSEMGANLPYVDLGQNVDVQSLSMGGNHVCAVTTAMQIKCWGSNVYGELGLGDTESRGDKPNEMGTNLPYVDLGPHELVVRVATYFEGTCAQLMNRTVKCWGDNLYGQLGAGHNKRLGDDAGEMGGALLPIYLGKKQVVQQVSAGGWNVCAMVGTVAKPQIKCWGRNTSGQLGLGHTRNVGAAPNEMGDNLPYVEL